jgi:hypothetical protein
MVVLSEIDLGTREESDKMRHPPVAPGEVAKPVPQPSGNSAGLMGDRFSNLSHVEG